MYYIFLTLLKLMLFADFALVLVFFYFCQNLQTNLKQVVQVIQGSDKATGIWIFIFKTLLHYQISNNILKRGLQIKDQFLLNVRECMDLGECVCNVLFIFVIRCGCPVFQSGDRAVCCGSTVSAKFWQNGPSSQRGSSAEEWTRLFKWVLLRWASDLILTRFSVCTLSSKDDKTFSPASKGQYLIIYDGADMHWTIALEVGAGARCTVSDFYTYSVLRSLWLKYVKGSLTCC